MPQKTRTLDDIRDHLALAREAAQGDASARGIINRAIHPIITYQTNRFCRRFCHGNRYRYGCTLQPPIEGRTPPKALLCEYGNASYAWMLEDLTSARRLMRFEGRRGARINDYIYRIANSLPFYERWKDWRFGRKVHVPTYIQDLGPLAGRAFLLLRSGKGVMEIAFELGLSAEETEALCQDIVAALGSRSRLHLLDPPRTISLSEPDHGNDPESTKRGGDKDILFHDEALEQRETKKRLHQAWERLSTTEQFVLEAMLIDGQDARDVLAALERLSIAIKRGVAPGDTNRQQLYYFRRKVLSKLADLMQASD